MSGFFGKLPAVGDFVWRRLPKPFRDRWDSWLDAGLRASRDALADRWLECYLGAPMWRFALAPRVIDQQTWVGVLMPSVDSAGRYFPLTVAASCERHVTRVGCSAALASWYSDVEVSMLRALEDEALDIDAFDEEVAQLRLELDSTPAPRPFNSDNGGSEGIYWTRMGQTGEFGPAFAEILDQIVSTKLGMRGLWWTSGGTHIEPTLAVSSGLVPPDRFHALLTGRFGPNTTVEDGAEVESRAPRKGK